MPQSKVLSPIEVSQKYLNSGILKNKVNESFNIFKIEEIVSHITLPHYPFKNTAHGFIFLAEGKIEMSLNQEQFTFCPNSCIITPAGQMNNFIKIDTHAKGFIGTFSSISILLNHSEDNFIGFFEKMLSPEKMPHFNLEVSTFELIHQIINRIWHLHYSKNINRLELISNYLRSVLLELHHLYNENKFEKNNKSDELVTNFKKLLIKEIQNNPKSNEFAKKLNVSTNHLNKVLKKLTKRTTSEWINQQKILEAKHLLNYSTKNISEIAYSLGFSEPSHFSKFFKKHTGVNPLKYKND